MGQGVKVKFRNQVAEIPCTHERTHTRHRAHTHKYTHIHTHTFNQVAEIPYTHERTCTHHEHTYTHAHPHAAITHPHTLSTHPKDVVPEDTDREIHEEAHCDDRDANEDERPEPRGAGALLARPVRGEVAGGGGDHG